MSAIESPHFFGLPWPDLDNPSIYVPKSRYDYTVRRAFLQSYQLSTRESFGDWLRRSLKEAGDAGKAIFYRVLETRFDMRRLRKAFYWRLKPHGCFILRRSGYIDDLF